MTLLAPAMLRALAATMIAALLFRAPLRAGAPLRPLVALDVSASWMRGGAAGSRWPEATVIAKHESAGDSILLVGDSLRLALAAPPQPTATSSSPISAAERARRDGRALLLISDGEGGSLPRGALPSGSRVEVLRRQPIADLAVARLEVPTRAAPGDTMTILVTTLSGDAGSAQGSVAVQVGEAPARAQPLAASEAFAERTLSFRVPVPALSGPQVVRAIAHMPNDAESANDTLMAVVEITRTPVAVLVSSAPDPDARDALEALRGALAAPPVGYYRVAPGQWRSATSLAAVGESEVRRALANAPLAVLHGDTALLGAPMAVTRGSLILIVPGDADERNEWRAAPAPDSPLAAALTGIAWDSVPPIDPAATGAKGDWTALSAARPSGGDRRALVAGGEQAGRRRAIVAASGLWRWHTRGGVPADAYGALWGALIDWVGRTRPDARAALPEAQASREGDPIVWRRGGFDTLVTAIVSKKGDGGARDTLHLAFSNGATTVQSPPLTAGQYAVTVPGGSAMLVVNRSREFLPARQTIRSAATLGSGPRAPATPLRERWWPFALALAALCGEWILRRRAGLR